MPANQYLVETLLKPYLAGVATDAEKEEVEQLLATDPDIQVQIDDLELDLEQYVQQNAITPPPGLSSAIWQRIGDDQIKKWEPQPQTQFTPPVAEPPKSSYIDVEVSDTHIRVHKYWRTAFIAVFILSKVFLVLGLYYYFKADSQAQEIERLKTTIQQNAPAGRVP